MKNIINKNPGWGIKIVRSLISKSRVMVLKNKTREHKITKNEATIGKKAGEFVSVIEAIVSCEICF